MVRRTIKIKNKCQIEITRVRGSISMKCKNLKRPPTAQEIINEIKPRKIKYS